MKSADLAPSRLDRARQKLLDLLQQRREGQTGLIAYAGDAHIVTPLTDDTPTIANLLPALHPDMMPVPGSDPAGAVTQAWTCCARRVYARASYCWSPTAYPTGPQSHRKALSGSGAQLTIMGMGTATGAPIPLPDGGFLKDQRGHRDARAGRAGLRELAAAAGGRYLRMQIDSSDLDYLLAENPLTDRGQTLALDRTADSLGGPGLPVDSAAAASRPGPVPPRLAALPATGIAVGTAQPASAQTWEDLWLTPDQQGQRALQQGDNEAAAALFEDPDWAGTAAYRGGTMRQPRTLRRGTTPTAGTTGAMHWPGRDSSTRPSPPTKNRSSGSRTRPTPWRTWNC